MYYPLHYSCILFAQISFSAIFTIFSLQKVVSMECPISVCLQYFEGIFNK